MVNALHTSPLPKSTLGAGTDNDSDQSQPVDHSSMRYAAPALDKGLDILEALAAAPGGLTLKQLGEELQRRPSEIFRMVVRLHERGYVSRGNDDAYSLTAKLLALAHKHLPTKRLVDTALPLMHALSNELGQSCHLAQLHEPDVVVIAEVIGPGPLCLTVGTGTRHAAEHTSSGRLLLALCGSRAIPPKARRVLSEAGFVQQPSRLLEGVVDISAAVFDYTGRPTAAVTIPALIRRNEGGIPARTAGLLRGTASALSRSLGSPSAAGM